MGGGGVGGGPTPNQGRRGKHKVRPGSRAEEESLENTLARRLPTTGSPFHAMLSNTVLGASALGAARAARGVVCAWESLLGLLGECTLPPPRRDVCQLVWEARRDMGIVEPTLPPALGAAIMVAFPPTPKGGDPVEALRDLIQTPPTLPL